MARKLGWMFVILAVAVPAFATETGRISGVVKNARGVPQMGAAVELITSGVVQNLIVFTDSKGQYSIANVAPGRYMVKVSAPSFLPSLRENVNLRSGSQLVINLTLNTIFEAAELLPKRRSPNAADDDWKWTLRSAANRPVLRVLENGPLVVVTDGEDDDDRVLKAQVAFIAGAEAEGFGSAPDVSTAFLVEHSIFRAGTLSFHGNLGYGEGLPTGTVRAGYAHRLPNGSEPELAFTARRFAQPEYAAHRAALSSMSVTLRDDLTLAEVIDIEYGGELQAVQFAHSLSAPFRPFGAVSVHLSPNTVLQYRYATTQPNTRAHKGFDTTPADLSEGGPRVSLADYQPVMERARHQEISLSQRMGKTSVQLGFYADSIRNTALTGVGDPGDFGDALPDVYSGTFSYNGGALQTNGLRVVVERKLTGNLTGTLNYGYGGTLDAGLANAGWDEVVGSLYTARRHTLAAKFAGTAPRTKTRWLASYKWTSGGALLPVDAFNASAGQADPFFNIFIRQPMPDISFIPGRMEALVDVRNLLAQGYVPVISNDGNSMYLVQSARSVRGGVAFTF